MSEACSCVLYLRGDRAMSHGLALKLQLLQKARTYSLNLLVIVHPGLANGLHSCARDLPGYVCCRRHDCLFDLLSSYLKICMQHSFYVYCCSATIYIRSCHQRVPCIVAQGRNLVNSPAHAHVCIHRSCNIHPNTSGCVRN